MAGKEGRTQTLEETRSIITGYGLRPKKRLGQHFIREQGIIQEIMDRAGFRKSDQVLEVGPGLGALTIPLAGSVRHVIAVEKASRLSETLEKRLSQAGINNVTLINDDILKVSLNGIPDFSSKKIKVIGNLPYNISSPFIEKLLRDRDFISSAVLMFQMEFARRLTASPGGKEYGALTVLIQYNAGISPLFEVPKEAFYPRPKVGSMVLGFDMESPHPRRVEDEDNFKRVVRGAFAHRRKIILNSLKGGLPSLCSEEITTALGKCDIDSGRRAETLDIDEFICLASALAE